MLSSHRLCPSSCSFAVAFMSSPSGRRLCEGRTRSTGSQQEKAIDRYDQRHRSSRPPVCKRLPIESTAPPANRLAYPKAVTKASLIRYEHARACSRPSGSTSARTWSRKRDPHPFVRRTCSAPTIASRFDCACSSYSLPAGTPSVTRTRAKCSMISAPGSRRSLENMVTCPSFGAADERVTASRRVVRECPAARPVEQASRPAEGAARRVHHQHSPANAHHRWPMIGHRLRTRSRSSILSRIVDQTTSSAAKYSAQVAALTGVASPVASSLRSSAIFST